MEEEEISLNSEQRELAIALARDARMVADDTYALAAPLAGVVIVALEACCHRRSKRSVALAAFNVGRAFERGIVESER